jgi:hypothetical protein
LPRSDFLRPATRSAPVAPQAPVESRCASATARFQTVVLELGTDSGLASALSSRSSIFPGNPLAVPSLPRISSFLLPLPPRAPR